MGDYKELIGKALLPQPGSLFQKNRRQSKLSQTLLTSVSGARQTS